MSKASKVASPRSVKGGSDGPSDEKKDASSAAPAYRPDPKGDELMKQAEKTLNKGALSGLFSGRNKHEDAIELITKAAAQYKVSKNWQEAGDAFVKAAEIYERNLKEQHDACNKYIEAARAYKNCNTELAIKYYQIAVDIHMENNKFSTAAKLWKDIAELLEKELDYTGAKNAWAKAADCYDAEDSTANATACHIKVAALAAELEDFKGAIQIYEKVSAKALEGSSAGRWGVKDYLFKALLCHLVLAAKQSDMVPVERAVEKYKEMLPQLDGTREVKLIEDLAAAFTADDIDQFSDTVFRYDEIYRLDNWTAKVLLQVKNVLKNGPQGQDNDDFS